MIRALVSVLLISTPALAAQGAASAQDTRVANELTQWVRGDDRPAWRKIGWRPALGPAILEASDKRKPILLWAMNGHPLGCT